MERQKKFFIDRKEIEQLENALLPLDGSRPPKTIFVTGLLGIGRRTLIKHTSPNLLSLRKIAQIRIGEGDNINDICISVADLSEPYSTRNGFERIILTSCYFKTGELDKALSHIEGALKIHGNNPFLVDLWAQIACCQRDEITARKALERLEAIGDPLEVVAHLIYCEIELKYLEQSENLLDQLDTEYQNTKRDIRLGLRCRIEIARGQFSKALSDSERISDKNTPFYKRIRRDALSGELQFAALDDKVRDEYEKERFELDEELSQIEMDQYIPSDFEF